MPYDVDDALDRALKVVSYKTEQRAKIALQRIYAYTPMENAEVAAGLRPSKLSKDLRAITDGLSEITSASLSRLRLKPGLGSICC